MKILMTSDWHIKLGQKNVPKDWQRNRFLMLVDLLNKGVDEHKCDLHIIGGDILDVTKPSAEELNLFFECVSKLNHLTVIYTGNHEALTKTHSSLYELAAEVNRCNKWVTVLTDPYRSQYYDVIDYIELHKKDWEPSKSKLCFTHVRGEIPPHVKPEIDLSKFSDYDLVITGDLHSHQNTQGKFIYPGSPMTTSFHRTLDNSTNGYLIVDTETLEWNWYNLELPQLLRKTVDNPKDMLPDPYHRVIYELTGDVMELGKVSNMDLLDKKINTGVSKSAKLEGLTGNISEEVNLYCSKVLGLDKGSITKLVTRLYSEVQNLDD